MSRCSHNSVSVCPLLWRNWSSNFRRLSSAKALKTASTILNMQPFGCICKKNFPHSLGTLLREEISQSFNPHPSYLPALLRPGLEMRTKEGETSALGLVETEGSRSSIPS